MPKPLPVEDTLIKQVYEWVTARPDKRHYIIVRKQETVIKLTLMLQKHKLRNLHISHKTLMIAGWGDTGENAALSCTFVVPHLQDYLKMCTLISGPDTVYRLEAHVNYPPSQSELEKYPFALKGNGTGPQSYIKD